MPLPEQSRDNTIEATKVDIAVAMILTGITIGATTFISGVNEVETAGAGGQEVIEKTTSPVHAIAYNSQYQQQTRLVMYSSNE